jgi:hypothetical protein
MSNILLLSKSPCIFEVTDPNLESGYLAIFIWKVGDPVPTLPQYTLSKLIPASNVTSIFFDISPYANEYVSNKICTINSSVNDIDLQVENYTYIQIYKYKTVASVTTLVGISTFFAFKGYLEQYDKINPISSDFLLYQRSYNYYYNSSNIIAPGDITGYITSGNTVKYTNLKTGSIHTYTISTTGWKKIFRVYSSFIADGNKVEILNGATVLVTYYFTPIEECKYTPVVLDFINIYGAWQREFLFKNSTESITIENQSYKNYRSTPMTLNIQENLITTFNTNGTESIKCNTGWVEENFKDNLGQLLLSDRILINNRPAIITTKQIELQKNINNKLINYSLDFQFTNSII